MGNLWIIYGLSMDYLWIIYGLSMDNDLVSGFNPSEKYEFVSWDYYSQYLEKSKMFQTTNQIYKE